MRESEVSRSRRSAEATKQVFKDLAMNRLREFEPAMEALHPANGRFEWGQSTELDPYDLTNSGSFDELGPAAAFGKIVDFDEETHFPTASKQDLGVDRAA